MEVSLVVATLAVFFFGVFLIILRDRAKAPYPLERTGSQANQKSSSPVVMPIKEEKSPLRLSKPRKNALLRAHWQMIADRRAERKYHRQQVVYNRRLSL